MKIVKAPTELDLALAEYARLCRCEKLQDDKEMLTAALNGGEATIESVTRLLEFVAKYMPRGIPWAHWTCATRSEADGFDRWWRLCSDFLIEAGVPEDQLPPKRPAPGDPGFVSVLDEFDKENKNV